MALYRAAQSVVSVNEHHRRIVLFTLLVFAAMC